ncbi:MAG TPA: FMN-binding negative transcriptional regulator [Gammaproteobacteria bacterium]|nr:FMN-binding negative transcriptional regulator [Gammaproteobacteria bacterium]
MYIPKHFEQTDERALWEFVDAHAFGTLLTVTDGEPFASHLPFLVDPDQRVLHCHVARANPQWQAIAASPRVLAIFAGPHGYVSPTWYAEPGVPTWNYAVVHARGEARTLDDAEHTRRHVEALAAKFERGRAAPWVPDYDVRRLKGIVGVEIRVDKLEGKFKLSQNRSAADRERVVAELTSTGRDNDAALAQLMTAAVPRSPSSGTSKRR